jgi:2-keto-4-pentenoate hydratase
MIKRIDRSVWLLVPAIFMACESVDRNQARINQLGPEADQTAIVEYLLKAEREKNITEALSVHFPEMERAVAYDIQNAILKAKEMADDRIGWKVGYSRVIDAGIAPDPIYGHMMASGLSELGVTVTASNYARGAPYIEAEIAFRINRDLTGPVVTRNELVDAIDGVAPAVELVSGWVQAAQGREHTRNHDIAGNVTHVGLVPGAKWWSLDEVDFSKVAVRVEIDGLVEAEGHATLIMGEDPISSAVWLANELPKYGYLLRAGDIIITGTVLDPPRLEPGSTARAVFETLGDIEISVATH